MADFMCKEQREYIENIERDMFESTNMTKEEAYEFAFRCWQCGYAKEKGIRAKAIDEFKAEAMKQLTDLELKDSYATVTECKIILRDIAEQMKGE